MQNVNAAFVAQNAAKALVPLQVDGVGNLKVAIVESSEATSATYNITTATVVKATPGTILKVSVIVAGAAGTLNNCITTGAAAASNQVAVLPATVGTIDFGSAGWPCSAGITVVPGAGQTIAISWI